MKGKVNVPEANYLCNITVKILVHELTSPHNSFFNNPLHLSVKPDINMLIGTIKPSIVLFFSQLICLSIYLPVCVSPLLIITIKWQLELKFTITGCLTSFLWWYVSPTLIWATRFPPVRGSRMWGTVTTRSYTAAPSDSSSGLNYRTKKTKRAQIKA